MALRIVKSHIDRLTSHVTVEACVQEEVNGQLTEGPMETFGIDKDALLSIHTSVTAGAPTPESMNDAIVEWLHGMHDLALARKRAHDHSSLAVAKLAGKVIQFSNGNGSAR